MQQSTSTPRKDISILFIDDDQSARQDFKTLFGQKYTIHLAEDAESALDQLRDPRRRIAVAITDYDMPKQNGLDVLKTLKSEYPAVVRVMSTGYMSVNLTVTAVNEGGVFRLVEKPWDVTNLRQVIDEAILSYKEQVTESVESDLEAFKHACQVWLLQCFHSEAPRDELEAGLEAIAYTYTQDENGVMDSRMEDYIDELLHRYFVNGIWAD